MAVETVSGGSQTQLRSRPDLPEWTPRRRPTTGTIIRHVVLALFAIVILFPIVWVLLLSLKTLPDAYQNEIWPSVFDFGHYLYSLQRIPTLPRVFLNSVMVTTSTVILTTICAILGGYALVHLRMPGRAL
nr:hypothetical protein [Chloroflexota bacterium]